MSQAKFWLCQQNLADLWLEAKFWPPESLAGQNSGQQSAGPDLAQQNSDLASNRTANLKKKRQ
jgi:hypothetical protein